MLDFLLILFTLFHNPNPAAGAGSPTGTDPEPCGDQIC